MSTDPAASARKLVARRMNERLKLFAAFLNALAIGVVATAIVIPVVQNPAELLQSQRAIWFLFGVSLHLAAQWVFAAMRSED